MSEQILKEILSEIQSIKIKVDGIQTSQIRMEQKLEKIDQRLEAVEGKLDEDIQVGKALTRQSEFQKAQMDALMNTTASNDSITRLDTKMERLSGDVHFLVRKAVEHEDDIRNLRLIK